MQKKYYSKKVLDFDCGHFLQHAKFNIVVTKYFKIKNSYYSFYNTTYYNIKFTGTFKNPEKIINGKNPGSVSGITGSKTQNETDMEGKQQEHFFSKNPNPIIRAGKDGIIIFANEAALPLLESWGTAAGETLPPELRNLIRDVFEKERGKQLEVQAGEKVYSVTFQPVLEDEVVDLYGFDINDRKQAEKEENEKHTSLENLLKSLTREISFKNENLQREINERKKVEKTLRNHLRFLKTMMDAIPAPVYYKDGEGKYLGCNKLFESLIMGLEEKELIGKLLNEVETKMPPAVARGYQMLDMELLRKGGKHVYETELLCSDGLNRNFLASRVVFRDKIGNVALLAGVLLDISELKHVEKALLENLHFQEIFLDAIPIPIFYKDMKGTYLSCNEMFAGELLGLSKEKVIGKTMYDLKEEIPEELTVVYEKSDRKVMREGEPLCFEAKAKCSKRGEIRDFLYTKALYSDIDGNSLGIVSVMQDISNRKIAEKILRESEERYRLAAEQTGQLIYDHDMLTGTNDWAGAIEKLTGYRVEEYQIFNIDQWSDHIHPEDRKTAVCAHYHNDDVYHEEYRLRRKDGSYFYAEDSGKYLRNEKGDIYRLLGVIKDITEQKLSREKLEKSEERFRSFMENFKGIAYQGNMDFRAVFMHGAVKEITGYEAEEFTSGRLLWDRMIFPEDMPLIMESSEALRSDPKVLIEREYRIKHKDGKVRWAHELIQNVCDASGKPVLLQGSIYDITERKEAEEILEKVQGVRKREIHHRIKNNLQVISSLLELQAEKFRDEEVLEAFRESQNRVISMSLIHESLHGSRDVETLDFAAYLRKLTAELLASYTSGSEEISLQLDIEEVYFGMDTAIPLGIIINELFSNSLKHAFPEGKGNIYIKLYGSEICENVNSLFTLVVSDNGVGFPEEFDFRDMDSLGLQLVNTLVDQIEGTIELERGLGTKFRLNFEENVHSIIPS